VIGLAGKENRDGGEERKKNKSFSPWPHTSPSKNTKTQFSAQGFNIIWKFNNLDL
jgi:hypothetical protein